MNLYNLIDMNIFIDKSIITKFQMFRKNYSTDWCQNV